MLTQSELHKYWMEGYTYYMEHGTELFQNPYCPDSFAGKAWRGGWFQAFEDY